jgi:predicted nuclease of predicted toxin-antitoxin system
MARLYADENFPGPIVRRLRDLGHDVLTCREAGFAKLKLSDAEALRFASEDGRTVLTRDRRDFPRLHRLSNDYAGIVVCRTDRDNERQSRLIHAALEEIAPAFRKLIRVSSAGFRVDER